MDFGKEAIEKIQSLVEAGQVITIRGEEWARKGFEPVRFEPNAAAVEVQTLTGLVDFLAENIDKIEATDHLVHVAAPDLVNVFSRMKGLERKRDKVVAASVDEHLKAYPFETYLSVESFVIQLRSLFEPSEGLERLIAFVSKVSGGTSFGLDDDGITQTVNMKKGVSGALTTGASSPAIVKLRPYRSFREIHQIESEFLFRMKLIDTEKQIVGCALFEADGGRWRNNAVIAVKEFLQASLGNTWTVIA